MTSPPPSWGYGTGDNATVPSVGYPPTDPTSSQPAPTPRPRQRWPFVLLELSLILGVAGGATIIVLLTGDDADEVATSERRTDKSTRGSNSTEPSRSDDDASSSNDSDDSDGGFDDSEPEVTLGDRNPVTTDVSPSPAPPGDGAVPTTTGSAPTSSSVSPTSDSVFPPRTALEGKYVAMVWSELRSGPADAEIQAKVSELQARYGDGIFGVRDGTFASLKDGSIGVALDNNFTSARQAAEWCRNEGLVGHFTCFGVVLNDVPFVKDERGDYRRMYPEKL